MLGVDYGAPIGWYGSSFLFAGPVIYVMFSNENYLSVALLTLNLCWQIINSEYFCSIKMTHVTPV